MKLWSTDSDPDGRVELFTVGNDYLLDQELVVYDCRASIAHAKMLGKIGILTSDEVGSLMKELQAITELAEQGEFEIHPDQEDCHTAIEEHLTKQLGDLGKKIHTGRSRNDQVVTALRLYYRDQLNSIIDLVNAFGAALNAFVKKYGKIEIPGFTHTRKAMPTSISTWARAFSDAMIENVERVEHVLSLIDKSPLGAGAGYGVPLDIDRNFTAEELEFSRVQENPLATQNTRGKYETDILHACSQVLFDLNKMGTDLIWYSAPEYGFFSLPEKLCTGSSIMPQKKNPDIFELVRAKYHQVTGWLNQIQRITSNLTSGYHRDLQLTKEPVMRGVKTTQECLEIMTYAVENLGVSESRCTEAMTEDLFATEQAYKLVKKGMPFRDAYRTVSKNFRGT